jgi:hypothetical protein
MIPEFFPRDRYYCVLDEQPEMLVPPTLLNGYGQLHDVPLIVNPRCWPGWKAPLPPALSAAAVSPDRLFDIPWIIWVEDPDRATLWPYWLGREFAGLLEDLRPGTAYAGDLPPQAAAALEMADILITPEAPLQRRRAWASASAVAATQFSAGYVQLSRLLPPAHVGALRRYYRYHMRMGTFPLGDEQTAGRYVAYDEPMTRYIHHQLTYTLSDVIGSVIKPSYSYLAFYQGGAELEPHTDREACEYTLSLCIDATPDPMTYGAWPLHLMTPDGPRSYALGIGEALLFRGRQFAHWRDRLPDGYTASSVLFHFVDA